MFYQNKAGLINTSNLINLIENHEYGKLVKTCKIKKKKLFKLNLNGSRFLYNIALREREREGERYELNSISFHVCYYIIHTKRRLFSALDND